jgi:hypothetical protein
VSFAPGPRRLGIAVFKMRPMRIADAVVAADARMFETKRADKGRLCVRIRST